MSYIVLDFESFYSKEYSLRKMTPVQYILDPRFEFIGCAVCEGDNARVEFLEEDAFRRYLLGKRQEQKAGKRIVVASHNALFDMCILVWRFGLVPDLMIDTMSMFRALHFHETGSVSLATMSRHFGLEAKGNTILRVEGMSGADIKRAGLWSDYVSYATHDANLCAQGFERMRPHFPPQELLVNDLVIRAAAVPRFQFDMNLLAEHLHSVVEGKKDLLDRVGLKDPGALMSNEKFAEALRQMGVEPPTKTSPATGKETYAFAKTDPGMAELDEHPDPMVQALVAARLGFKSTMEETRTQRFLDIAGLEWPAQGQKRWAPIPLRYAGAHTHRFSGDWGQNMQNLGRKSLLRKALVAPKGHVVIACDSAQIEARFSAWQAGQEDLTQSFRDKRDVYSEFAGEEVFMRPITKADKKERFIGKTCLAEGTLVYTKRGLVPIEAVTTDDQVWDGEEWVCHKGVACNGWKTTLELCGIWLTPDHRVWCGTSWKEAGLLARDVASLSQALGTAAASSPSQVTYEVTEAGSKLSSSGATAAARNTQSTPTTSKTSSLLGATLAPRVQRLRSVIGATRRLCLTMSTALASSTVWLLPSLAAIPLPAGSLSTTAVGASRSSRTGETTGRRSCDTPKRFPDGMTPLSGWTGLTTAAGTSPGTSGSSAVRPLCSTGGGSPTLRRRSRVYDVLSAGPRHRFMVQTKQGPLIVHNCILGLGYGMGPPKFTDTVRTQSRLQLGELYDLDLAGGTEIVNAYRRRYHRIAAAWRYLQNMIPRIAAGVSEDWGPIRFEHQAILLPSGLRLYYDDLRQEQGSKGFEWIYTYGKKPKRLFGGKLFENIIQALARQVIAETAVRMRKHFPRYPMAHQVHDELIYVVPQDVADEFGKALLEEMHVTPSWAPGLPLAAEIGFGPSYGEVDK
jgi:hypothetical protein